MDRRLQLLLTIPETREELREWLKTFGGADLIYGNIDQNSTSNPVQAIWECVQFMRTGEGPSEHLLKASRDSAKTYTAAVLEFLSMLWFRRDVIHLAATLEQSASAIGYLDGFLMLPEINQWSDRSNARLKTFHDLPPSTYAGQVFSKRDTCKLRIAVANAKGINSLRGSAIFADEIDLVDASITEDLAYCATQTFDRLPPMNVWLSSQKTPSGPVQMVVDRAKTDMNVRIHSWSIVDWMERCPPERHLPDQPVDAAIDLNTMKVAWDDAAREAPDKLVKVKAFEGCRTCKAFLACQARAPSQDSESARLRTIRTVGDIISKISTPDYFVSQTLNLRPSTAGLIFRTFKRETHVLKHRAAYKWITNSDFNPQGLPEEDLRALEEIGAAPVPTTKQIYDALVSSGYFISSGLDYGYHVATVVVGGYNRSQRKGFILKSVFSPSLVQNFDNISWSRWAMSNVLSDYRPQLICPDVEDASSPRYFRGFGVQVRSKKPRKIETGVSFIRSLLFDMQTQQERLVILDDENEDLVKEFETWSEKRGPTGYVPGTYEDGNDHGIDSARYLFDIFVEGVTQAKDHSGPPKVVQEYDTDDEIILRRKVERTGAGHAVLTQEQVRDSMRAALEGTYQQHVSKKSGRFSLR